MRILNILSPRLTLPHRIPHHSPLPSPVRPKTHNILLLTTNRLPLLQWRAPRIFCKACPRTSHCICKLSLRFGDICSSGVENNLDLGAVPRALVFEGPTVGVVDTGGRKTGVEEVAVCRDKVGGGFREEDGGLFC